MKHACFWVDEVKILHKFKFLQKLLSSIVIFYIDIISLFETLI